MKKSKLFPFFLGIIMIMMLILPLINSVQATTYYEWVDNYSFESAMSNYVLNPSFELGNNGFQYWDYTGNVFMTTDSRTGINATNIGTSGSGNNIKQTFSNISTSLISTIGFYGKLRSGCSSAGLHFYIDYSDSSFDDLTPTISTSSYTFFNFTTYLDVGKAISYIQIWVASYGGTLNIALDDFIIGGTTGQTEINTTSQPWFDNNEGIEDYLYSGINIAFGYSGTCHYYTQYFSMPLRQKFDYLDTNFIYNASLWYYAIIGASLEWRFIYSDGSESFGLLSMTGSSTWTQLDYSNYVLPNKLLVEIKLRIIGDTNGSWIGIDDISILSEVLKENASVFTWEIYPTPTVIGTNSFSAYQLQSYTFTGYVKNSSGLLEEDGNFTVSHSKGVTSGNMTNGVFFFTIVARNGISDFNERFTFIIMTEENEIYNIQIDGHWINIAPTPTDEGNIPNTNIPVTTLTDFMILFMFIFAPSMIFGFYCGQHNVNPIFGFLCAFNVMSLIGVISTLVSLWVILVTIILDIVMGLYLFEKSKGG